LKKDKEDSAEKLKLDNERKKIREEGMKKWREKWTQREGGKGNGFVEIAGVAQVN
jgi:hypothetical protein